MPVNIKKAKQVVEKKTAELKDKLPTKKSPEKGPGAFKKINDLGEEKVALLNSLFLEGKSVPHIIDVLQDGWGVFKDTNANTLTKYLYRYKWEVIDKGLAIKTALDISVKGQDGKKMMLVKEALADLNILSELQELIVVQKSRVKKLLDREQDMPMLFNSLGGEMKTLAGFIGQFVDTSFEMGAMKRAPSIHKINKDGITTVVESEGKTHVELSLAASQQVADAANDFYKVLEAAQNGEDSNVGSSVH